MNKKIILLLSLVIIWMIIIFTFSNMDSKASNKGSKGTINKIVEITLNTSNKLGIINELPTKEEQQIIINKLNKPLRKVMHFTVYLILSILILHTLNKLNIKKQVLITLLICIIYAMTDEYHQTFISGRTGQFTDVIIDTLGSTTGIIIYNKIKDKKDNKRQNISKRQNKK